MNIDLVQINTAFLTGAGLPGLGADERKLIVPEYALHEAREHLTEGSYRIYCTHHPLAMLNESSAKILENELNKYSDLHLFGHMHDPQPRSSIGLRGSYVGSQSGAIFTSRHNSYNGYSLLTIDRRSKFVECLLRSFFDERQAYDEAIDLIPGGIWYSSPESRAFFKEVATPIDIGQFKTHLAGDAFNSLVQRECSGAAEGDIHEKFVAPPLKRPFIQERPDDDGNVEFEIDLSFDSLVSAGNNLIVYSRPEYGRSTLIREVRYRLLRDAGSFEFPRLPVLIDFEEIKSNVDSLIRRVRGGAEKAPENVDIVDLLKLGMVCVLIDDVVFADSKRMAILRDFVRRFPKARYIFSTPASSAVQFGASVDPEMPNRFEFVEIQELKRSQMRELLTRDNRCTDVEVWVDKIQDEFRYINLPFTAANGSIFIEILSERYNFSPINRAVLMEQFIDMTLRKASIEQSRRETFDYTNKTDLLAYVAGCMAADNKYILNREELRAIVKAYIDGRGLSASIDELLTEFLDARIFIYRNDGDISFRYRGFLEYFIALRMLADKDFKSWILDESRYLNFLHEIQFYAGKVRNDLDLLKMVSERHVALLDSIFEEIGQPDFDRFDNVALPREDDQQELQELSNSVLDLPLSLEERDRELEIGKPIDDDASQEVKRPEIDDDGEKLLLSLLMYSEVVKNLELIPDATKRVHLRQLWKGWGTLLAASLQMAPKLAKERKLRVNGALYEVHAPQGMKQSVLLRHLMLKLPHVHLRWISGSLGTEKLERQLCEPELHEAGDPTIFEFFRVGLIADLRLKTAVSAISDFTRRLKGKRYLSWSFVEHLYELRRMARIRDVQYAQLEEPIADMIADFRGGSKKEIVAERGKQRDRLRRQRLVLQAKRKRDD